MNDQNTLPAKDEGDEFPDLQAGDRVPEADVSGHWNEEIDVVDLDEDDEVSDD